MGPLYPGGSATATVSFKGLEPPGNAASVVTNTAAVTNGVFVSGRPSNPATSQAITSIQPAGVIGDTVWRDQNRNGVQETNEVGIANVKVVLTPPTNVDAGSGIGVAVTNTTDRNGFYQFAGIISTGRYVVVVLPASLPNGGVSISNTWTEMSGFVSPTNTTVITNLFPAATDGMDKHTTADFGYYWAGATIDGLVWSDLNRSATPNPDSGEYGLTNVTVYLYSTTNALVPVATNMTDASGYFSFSGNFTGSYYVQITTNTGPLSGGTTWTQTFDTDGLSTTSRVTVTVSSGTTAHADFSYFQTGPYAVGDTLFYDWNGNGVQDASDEGIPNIPVLFYLDRNTNGVIDAGVDVLFATTNTSANGTYVFTNYPAGNYLVVVNQSATNFPPLFTITADPYAAKDGLSLVTVTNASNYLQDFGYKPYGYASIGDTVWRDLNADGIQSGLEETGISNVTVRLYSDLNGDGVYVLQSSTNTSASGQYLFTGLPDGKYKVTVDASSSSLPRDSFNMAYMPTTVTNVLVTVSGGVSVLTADFGFAALGAIGDTVFADSNANGSQDWNEVGITNVIVNLYNDVDIDGKYTAGTDTLYASRTTTTNGSYLFTALPQGRYVVVVDTNSLPLVGMHLTAAPLLDGQPLTNSAFQSVYSQVGVSIQPGAAYMGADFGFQPPGVIGQTVWVDSNGNGARDNSELGLANVALVLSNALVTVTNRTDVDGYYNFSGVADGTYWVRVLTNSANFAGLVPTYDPDGTNTANAATSVVILNGHIASVGGVARTNFDLSVNFGYQYGGNNMLSGTVGLDGTPQNGVLGTGISGVSADEVAYAGETVYLYVWRDGNSNGVVDATETTPIGSTLTDANGDYQFTGLPGSLGSGTNRYLVSLSAPQPHLTLTTTNGTTSAVSVVPTTNSFGEVISAYQVIAISPVVTNIDFAFKDAWQYDFGDLPDSYGTLLASGGAQHRVLTTPDLYLGSGVSTEKNGQPSETALLDTLDNGVTTSGVWQNTATGAQLQVTVGKGSGWLVGYIDFNRNGSFADSGEMVVSQNVTTNGGNGAGVYSFAVSVPSNSIQSASETTLYARFRLFPAEPAFPNLAYSGLADDGEVEDYRWDLGAIGQTVWLDSNGNGVKDAGEPPLAGVRVFADLNSNGVWDVGEPAGLTDANGTYGVGGFPSGAFAVTVDTNTLPAGIRQTYDRDGTLDGKTRVTLASGQVVTTADFGYAYPASISGGVCLDVNGNGLIEAGDTNGIQGASVQLLDTNNIVVASTTTAVNGSYTFVNVMPGSYLVRETDLSGYQSTTDTSAPNDNLIPVTVASGASSTGHSFYDVRLSAVGDFVWQDLNGNGIQDPGEPGLTNVTVRLLNVGSNLLATAVTDAAGSYGFTNLLPSTYLIQYVAPSGLVFTVVNAGTNSAADSDAGVSSGVTAPFVLSSGQTLSTLDAGLYVPAVVYGYLFVDRNSDQVRNSGDASITNALVRLTVNGTVVASTNSGDRGYYYFANVPPGAVSVLVSRVSANLLSVPDSSDVERNRALPDAQGVDAYVPYSVVSGYGVLAGLPGEPLNFGFATYPLSAAIDFRAYASGNGGVTVELWTVDESGYEDIVVYAWINNAWVEVGRVPSDQVAGEGSNRYVVQTSGLSAGVGYYFKIVDEAGHVHVSPTPVAVTAIRVGSVRFEMESMVVTFNTEYGRKYMVKVSESLGASATEWVPECVSYPTAAGWSDYSDQPFMAGPGSQTQVRIPVNRQKAFFKMVMVEE